MKKILIVMTMSAMIFTAGLFSKDGGHNKVVIQVSSGDEATQQLALNNANNVLSAVPGSEVEIVAYGPGLSMLTKKSELSEKIEGMAQKSEMTFSACENTMKNVEKKTGKKPVLTKGVKIVPAGVVRIMQLQEAGWSYVRP